MTDHSTDRPAKAQQILDRAYDAEASGDLEKALELCQAALQRAPDWAEAHNLHGIILEELGRMEEALDAYAQAHLLNPELHEARENLLDAEAEWLKDQRRRGVKPTGPPPPPGEDLVTIAQYSYPLHAHLARSRLQWAGIEAYVADDGIVGVNWLFSNAVGGVKVRVKKSDLAHAVQVLRQKPAPLPAMEDPTEEDPTHCPRCGSANVHQEQFHRRLFYFTWLVLKFPLPIPKQDWHCRSCGYQWKDV